MKSSEIWPKLKATLKNNPALSKYIKDVHEIIRYDLPPESFPCIMIQPARDYEIETDMNQFKRVFLNVDIYAYSHYNIADFHRSVVGDQIVKGVFDITNDIRACLMSSYTLGGTVYDIRIEPAEYADANFPDVFPNRGLKIPVKILYSQIDGD